MKQRAMIPAALAALLTGCAASKEAAAIGIIGGADGPTAIFVSSRLQVLPALIAAAAFIVCILLFVRYKKRKK